ncbi:MAG: class I SAM-dependent RNA methyltransferase [Thermodesulfobacteriota bacterium]
MVHTVEITGLAFGGKGVGRIDGKVVFVPYAAPGDLVRVRITKEKSSFSEGELAGIERPSPLRRDPPCPLFGDCGGCALQHMGDGPQLEWKQRILEETLGRIGKIKPEFDAPAPSPEAFGYRSRASFHVDGPQWGFYAAGSHRVVDVLDCPILDPALNCAYGLVRQRISGRVGSLYAVDIGLRDGGGFAVAFYVSGGRPFDWKAALAGVQGLTGFEVWRSPLKRGKGKRIIAEYDSRLIYHAAGLVMEAGVSVFTQVNRLLNPALIDRVAQYAGLGGTEKVVDLFAGVGNLSLPLARGAGGVTGVEEDAAAVAFARKNAQSNGIENARFIRSSSAVWVRARMKNLEKEGVDVVILDPPRGGDPAVAEALSVLRPRKIVYVSCSPPTLARDISLLSMSGYGVFRAGLFDMFPQTYHIESVAGLELLRR